MTAPRRHYPGATGPQFMAYAADRRFPVYSLADAERIWELAYQEAMATGRPHLGYLHVIGPKGPIGSVGTGGVREATS